MQGQQRSRGLSCRTHAHTRVCFTSPGFVLTVLVCGVCQWCLVTLTCVLRMVVLLGLEHMSSHTHVSGPCSTMQRIRGHCARTCVLQKQGIRGDGSVAWVVF